MGIDALGYGFVPVAEDLAPIHDMLAGHPVVPTSGGKDLKINVVRLWDVSTGRAVGSGKVDIRDFAAIGHSLWAIIVACLGGAVARLLATVKQQGREQESPMPADGHTAQ